MDSLARNAMLARQAGMSYGKWKALQPRAEPKKKELPEGWKRCLYCGKAFEKRKGKKFCDIYCRAMAYERKGNKNAEGGNGDG